MKKPADKKPATKPLRAKQHQRHALANTGPVMRKVTVNIPERLLKDDELGTTELIREALKWYQHRKACQGLLKLRGKLDLGITYAQLKEERE